MAALKNAKHELMAQALAQGKSQQQAYINAGYSPKGASGSASTLLKGNSSIFKRRDEILDCREHSETQAVAAAVKSSQLTLEGHLETMAMLRDRALEAREFGAAISAEKNRGTVAGFYVQRVEGGKPGNFSDRTEQQILQEIAEAVSVAQANKAIKKAME